MKKLYTTLVAVVAITQFSYAQWTNDPDRTTTQKAVGIGVTNVGGGQKL